MNKFTFAFIFLLLLVNSNTFALGGVTDNEEWYLPTEDNKAELYVYETGRGEPVIVIHGGFGAEHSYLLDAVVGLEAKNRFIFYDQRGSLRSPCKPEFISIEKHVQDVETLRKELGLEKITIFAHSMGTHLAMRYLQKYPERVKNLVLTGSIPAQSGKFLEPKLLPLLNDAGKSFLKFAERPEKTAALEKFNYKQPNQTAKQKTDIWRINFAAGNIYHLERWRQMKGGRIFYSQEAAAASSKNFQNDFDFTDLIANHSYPVTFINGDHDLADFGNVFYKNLISRKNKLNLIVLKNAGHNAWIDAPMKFKEELLKALNKK